MPELGKETTPAPAAPTVQAGDRIEMPIAPRGTVRGTVRHIDIKWGGKRYAGLVLVSDEDGSCYEIAPELVRHLPRSERGRAA